MTTPTYDTDFYTWTPQQAAALRVKDWAALDLENRMAELGRLELQALGYVKHGDVPRDEA
jgi:Domain of unknown function DUF29